MLGAAFAEVFSADIFVAELSVLTADPTALVAEEFYLIFHRFGQLIELIESFIQAKIGDDIPKILTLDFVE